MTHLPALIADLGLMLSIAAVTTLVFKKIDQPVVLGYILAGLLVGIGTRLANGCTSGHGVCGISRLSLRGIAATMFYLISGGLAVIVFRHLLETI